MKFIVCVSNGVWDFYVLITVLCITMRANRRTTCRGEKKCKTSAHQTMWQSWSAEHAMFLILLQLATTTEHNRETTFWVISKTSTLRNTLKLCWFFLAFFLNASPLPSFIQYIQ